MSACDLLSLFIPRHREEEGNPIVTHLSFYPEGLTHIITMDLHQKEIQGFFSFPVDNLRASPFLIQYIQEEVIIPFQSLLCVFKCW